MGQYISVGGPLSGAYSTSVNHEPFVINCKSGNALLLAEGDWNAINETRYLLPVTDMREAIIAGLQETLQEISTEFES